MSVCPVRPHPPDGLCKLVDERLDLRRRIILDGRAPALRAALRCGEGEGGVRGGVGRVQRRRLCQRDNGIV